MASLPFAMRSLAPAAVLAILPCLLLAFSSPASSAQAVAWPQADRLFRSDPLWLGGDAAFSVDLGHGRVLWLFGDSFVATKPGQSRREAAFARNTLAIETGYDPAHASIRFYSGHRFGKPSSWAPDEGANWFWPLDGVRLGDRLLLFYTRVASDPDPHSLGFKSVGWRAILVDNPDAPPPQWTMHKLNGPESWGTMLVGMALVRRGAYLYAFDLNNGNGGNFAAYLLRWRITAAEAGRLDSPQWWCGESTGWQTSIGHRQVVVPDAGSEFSVQPDPHGGFLEVHSAGFGASTIVVQHALHLEGPWSDPQTVYRPPESNAPDAFVYGAKAHPELHGADLVITYTANGSDQRLATDMSLYFPRFVLVMLAGDTKP
jgi:hypothetical protein